MSKGRDLAFHYAQFFFRRRESLIDANHRAHRDCDRAHDLLHKIERRREPLQVEAYAKFQAIRSAAVGVEGVLERTADDLQNRWTRGGHDVISSIRVRMASTNSWSLMLPRFVSTLASAPPMAASAIMRPTATSLAMDGAPISSRIASAASTRVARSAVSSGI